MTSIGAALVISAGAMAAVGFLAYLAARRSTGKSRGAALILFGHGALSTAGVLLLGTLIHVHAAFSVHVHSLSEALEVVLACDWDVSCTAWIATFVAGTVLALSFVVSQVVARAILARALRKGAQVRMIPGHPGVRMVTQEDPTPDAFSLAILRFGGPRLLHAEDYVVMNSGLLSLLPPEEGRAVLEHELAHVTARDDRYLPYFHTLAMIVFFDPLLRRLRRSLGHRYEFEADDTAARTTRDPRALARALLRVCESSPRYRRVPVPSFVGAAWCPSVAERIERLMALANRMDAGLD